MVGFYGLSTIVYNLISNPVSTYISNIYDLVWFVGISTIVGYLMPNPVSTYIWSIYYLVWFYDLSTIVDNLMPNPFSTYIFTIYDSKCLLLITLLNEPELILFHTEERGRKYYLRIVFPQSLFPAIKMLFKNT